jgi:protein SCO1/2
MRVISLELTSREISGAAAYKNEAIEVTVIKIHDLKAGASRMICSYNSRRPCINKAWSLLSYSIVSLALVVAGVGQVSAENGLIPGQSQSGTAARLQLTAVSAPADPHAHHRHMMDQKSYKRSTHTYDIPELVLVDKDNNKVSLNEALATDEPVMLNFIFTTCTTICPMLSATFAQVQRELGDEADHVRMISITIDPEYDTPERLRVYAERFKAGPQWQFYTGTVDDIVAIQKAFDAYRGSKANHEPLTFLHVDADPQWVRVNGLASASDVVKEYRRLLAE